jgi:hypothetical protein
MDRRLEGEASIGIGVPLVSPSATLRSAATITKVSSTTSTRELVPRRARAASMRAR